MQAELLLWERLGTVLLGELPTLSLAYTYSGPPPVYPV